MIRAEEIPKPQIDALCRSIIRLTQDPEFMKLFEEWKQKKGAACDVGVIGDTDQKA